MSLNFMLNYASTFINIYFVGKSNQIKAYWAASSHLRKSVLEPPLSMYLFTTWLNMLELASPSFAHTFPQKKNSKSDICTRKL